MAARNSACATAETSDMSNTNAVPSLAPSTTIELMKGNHSARQAYDSALKLLRHCASIADRTPRRWENVTDQLCQSALELVAAIPEEVAASLRCSECDCELLGDDLVEATATRCGVLLDILVEVAQPVSGDCDRARALLLDIVSRMDEGHRAAA